MLLRLYSNVWISEIDIFIYFMKNGLKWRVIQKFQFKHSWKTAQNTGNLAELLHLFFLKIIGQENWLNGRCWVKIVETTGLDKTYFNAVTLFLSFFGCYLNFSWFINNWILISFFAYWKLRKQAFQQLILKFNTIVPNSSLNFISIQRFYAKWRTILLLFVFPFNQTFIVK